MEKCFLPPNVSSSLTSLQLEFLRTLMRKRDSQRKPILDPAVLYQPAAGSAIRHRLANIKSVFCKRIKQPQHGDPVSPVKGPPPFIFPAGKMISGIFSAYSGKTEQNIEWKAKKSLSVIILLLFGIWPVSSLLTKLCKGYVNKFPPSEIHSAGACWLLCGCVF